MKGLRLAATVLCALLLLSLPAMADVDMGSFNPNTAGDAPLTDNANESSSNLPDEAEANHREIFAGTINAETEGSTDTNGDDDICGAWNGSVSEIPNCELPSQEQQKLEQKQQEREKAFAEAARENAEPAEEPKTPGSSGESGQEDTSPELVLPERETGQVSPMRYLLIGALLAAAICIAVYLFSHPVREEDAPSAQDKD